MSDIQPAAPGRGLSADELAEALAALNSLTPAEHAALVERSIDAFAAGEREYQGWREEAAPGSGPPADATQGH